jgi:hypothetical protein
MKKLDVGAERSPEIVNTGDAKINVPSGRVGYVPRGLALHKAQIGLSFVTTATAGVSGGVMSSGPTTALRTPVESLPADQFGRGRIGDRCNFLPVWRSSVAPLLAGFWTLP